MACDDMVDKSFLCGLVEVVKVKEKSCFEKPIATNNSNEQKLDFYRWVQ